MGTRPPTLTNEAVARQIFHSVGKGLDALAYTPEMERIHAEYVAKTRQILTVGEFYWALMNLRKRGGLAVVPRSRIGHRFGPLFTN